MRIVDKHLREWSFINLQMFARDHDLSKKEILQLQSYALQLIAEGKIRQSVYDKDELPKHTHDGLGRKKGAPIPYAFERVAQ